MALEDARLRILPRLFRTKPLIGEAIEATDLTAKAQRAPMWRLHAGEKLANSLGRRGPAVSALRVSQRDCWEQTDVHES